MARCELTMTTKIHRKRLALAVAYALAPAVYLGIISESRATSIAMRFVAISINFD